MMSCNNKSRLLGPLYRSLTTVAAATAPRRTAAAAAKSSTAALRRSTAVLSAVQPPRQFGPFSSSSCSKRTVYSYAPAETYHYYSSFCYHNHPSAPVTVGWINLEHQNNLSLQQEQPAAEDDFFGLPLRVDEQRQHQQDDDDDERDNSESTPDNNDPSSGKPEANFMNRNARRPKGANRGKRPVSRIARRDKKRALGNHRR